MTTVKYFSPAEVEAMVQVLFEKGLSPAKVRTRLLEQGIKWKYQFTGQGRGERLRRLKRLGQDICPKCLSGKTIGASLCTNCLAAKWSASCPAS